MFIPKQSFSRLLESIDHRMGAWEMASSPNQMILKPRGTALNDCR